MRTRQVLGLLVGLWCAACGGQEFESGGSGGAFTGGVNGDGGVTSGGAATSGGSGGNPASGGAVTSGGVSEVTGGAATTGGQPAGGSATGGKPASGGVVTSGGVGEVSGGTATMGGQPAGGSATGGSPATGGAVTSGGSTSEPTGGVAPTGGTIGAGGSTGGSPGTGGLATGGRATGGSSVGGTATGGKTTGGTSTGGAGGSGGYPECTTAKDCALLTDCCSCLPLPVGSSLPACNLMCIQSNCAARGIQPEEVACIAGRCVFSRTCNPAAVGCSMPTPACAVGEAPLVVGACYAGGCARVEDCSDVGSCDECKSAALPCATFQALPPSYHCVTTPQRCALNPTCACMGVCSGAMSCVQPDSTTLTCQCPGC